MPWWGWLLIFIAVTAVIVAVIKYVTRNKYTRRSSMLSNSENYFYYLFSNYLPNEYSLVPQAPMVVCFDSKVHKRSALNRILAKRFDYAIVRTEKLKEFPFNRLVTVAVIELDDASHSRKSRQKRDRFVNRVCQENKLPILRYACKSNKKLDYDTARIRRDIQDAIAVGDVFA